MYTPDNRNSFISRCLATPGNRAWHETLDLAGRFLTPESPPTETALKSAVDLCYFAIYHALCHSNAQALAGRLGKRHTGRLLQGLHGHG